MARDDDDYVIIEGDDDDEFAGSFEETDDERSRLDRILDDETIPKRRSPTGTLSFSLGLVFGFLEFVVFFIVGAVKRTAPIDVRAIIKGDLEPLALLMVPIAIHMAAIGLAFYGFVKKDGRRGMIIGAMGLNLMAIMVTLAIAGLSLIMK